MSAPSPTEAIARFVAETPAEAIPGPVRHAALLTLVDTFATGIAGAVEPASEVIAGSALATYAPGGSRLIGRDERLHPAGAALVNASFAHALDFDAISVAVSGFIGSAAGCAVSAWAEDRGPFSGADVVTAYCLGWEGAARVARGVNIHHYSKGWHPTATLSHFAAALACARLAGLDAEGTRAALGVAVSEASGVKTMIGNMLNPFHVGKAARNGVTAVDLVLRGFEASTTALEAPQGFLNVFNGADHADIPAMLEERWDLADPGPIFKVYPCCGLIHSGLDAVLALRREHDIHAADVTAVRLRVHEYVPRVMHVDVPQHGYAAKFSIPYCVGAALHDGRVDLATFDRVDPEVVELGRRVRAEVHPELRGDGAFLEAEFTEVEIETRSGTYAARVNRLENRGTAGNLHEADLRAKLADCLRHGHAMRDAAAEWQRIMAIDRDVRWEWWTMEDGRRDG